eukprot:TRINITY_DN2048_c0_g1_i1.p1 TRINITY_DN2048_c0_g1~~TRINITY_DN2048_c0_g1_i1.p1  ORF type:complete len:428 (+),score=104.10 TRINITY_DN2048_c0_g1_i1:958-2241(+)
MEIIISASSRPPAATEDEAIYAWQASSGQVLRTWTGNTSHTGGLALVGAHHLVGAQLGSSSLHFWSLAKEGAPVQKASAPERITSVAGSDDGIWLAAASEAGSIYLWQVASGRQLAAWSAHCKPVRQLVFGDGLLVSAGDDAVVHVWALAELTSADRGPAAEPRPLHTFGQHSLAVTGLWLGLDRLISVSMDRSCRVWSLMTYGPELTVALPAGATAVTAEPLACRAFVGTCDGRLWLADLRPTADGGALHAFASDAHRQAVTALSVSVDAMRLVSAHADGGCIVWHVPSRQRLVAFAAHKGAVTSVRFASRNILDAAARVNLGHMSKYKTVPAADPSAGWLAGVPLPLPAARTDVFAPTSDAAGCWQLDTVSGCASPAVQSGSTGCNAGRCEHVCAAATADQSRSQLGDWQTLSSQLFRLVTGSQT